MLQVIPKVQFDLTGIPTDFTVKISQCEFQAHRFLLITQSLYFRKALIGQFKEAQANELTINSDPKIFGFILKTINGETFTIPTVKEACEYFISLNFFQITEQSSARSIPGQVDLNHLHRELIVPPEQFSDYIDGLNRVYSEGFNDETVDLIAEKVRLGQDLRNYPPELERAILRSPHYPFGGLDDDLVDKMIQIAQSKKHNKMKLYINLETNQLHYAHCSVEAMLRVRSEYYKRAIQNSAIEIKALVSFPAEGTIQIVRKKKDDLKQYLDYFKGEGIEIYRLGLRDLEVALLCAKSEILPPLERINK